MFDTGLIIHQQWLNKIFFEGKTLEMRSRATSRRGRVGLIEGGSGLIMGAATLAGTSGPLGRDEMLALTSRHMIPVDDIVQGKVDKWKYGWELENAVKFRNPVPYTHPHGAVIWVKLPPPVQEAVRKEYFF
ncbi:hypothetical protein ACFOY8_14995 [Thalassospira xianhensis]|uniref:ASCH domain-containing protein n=1 Tax=Thalassospira xianhensis MCCC 1A02616 TaxID=1177929 RepID=A0A367UGW1_9PROT|nr:hypothetical protein [Thalassospira xianhensis]RCK07546.1 hypothetical protein TH5_00225 [Thalassospira xianhensis MCCC 1A02616]